MLTSGWCSVIGYAILLLRPGAWRIKVRTGKNVTQFNGLIAWLEGTNCVLLLSKQGCQSAVERILAGR